MAKVKELEIWFVDDSYMSVTYEVAENAAIELFQYSRNGQPRFIQLGEGLFYATSHIACYRAIEEVVG